MYVHSLYEVAATGTTVCVDTACTVQTALYNITAVFCHPLRSNEEQRLVDCKKKKKKKFACQGAQTRAREGARGSGSY